MLEIVDVFAIRHAQPLPGKDPGIDPSQAYHVENAAWAISTIYEDEGAIPSITVFSSPALRAVETARRFLQSKELGAPQKEPIVSMALAEDAFARESVYDASLRFIGAIHEMASLALKNATDRRKAVLVMVTHEPVLKRLPHLNNRSVNTNHTGINQFSVKV